MRTITGLHEEIASLKTQLGDMRSVCMRENRSPNEDEVARANSMLDQIEKFEAELALELRTQNAFDRLKKSQEQPEKTPVDTRKEKTEQQKRDSFASFGEMLQAVMLAGGPDRRIDPRLQTRAASGLSEGVPSDGGFLVDTEFASQILQNVWDTGQILPRIQKVTLAGNKSGLKLNGLDETSRVNGSRAGGITAYWLSEAGQATASKPKFRQIELNLNKLIGLCYATDELLEDATALEQVITQGFQKEFNFKITDSIINGTGAGQPLGILNAGCMVSVTKETGQVAATVVFENINKMWSRLMAASRTNSVWIINQDVEPQLNAMAMPVGTGGTPVYMPPGGISQAPYSSLFGRPVVPIEQCQTLGTTGDIMLCDFSQYMAIDKGGAKSAVSIHVRFDYDESVFRFVYRFDGQPVLKSAVTPFKGTNTLSHFVKLDTRA